MRGLASFEDTDIDELVPRSYYIYDPNQFREFLNDYCLNAARAIISRYSASFEAHGPVIANPIKRPTQDQVSVAIRVCNRFLSRYAVEHARVTNERDVSPPEGAEKVKAMPAACRWEGRVRALQAHMPLVMSHQEWVGLFGKKKAANRFPSIMLGPEVDAYMAAQKAAPEADERYCEEAAYAEVEALVEQMRSIPQSRLNGHQNVWIVKSVGLSRGRGIQVFHDLVEMLAYVKKKKYRAVVQKYMENPLTVHKRKFDVRQWVLVTSWNPLTVWVYSEFYLRFSSCEFSMDEKDLSNRYVHLTNQSIQKKNPEYGENAWADCNMWANDTFKEHLKGLVGEDEIDNVWKKMLSQIDRIVVDSLKGCSDVIDNRPASFELYGYDLMIDEDFRPWLIEVNSSPDMSKNAPILKKIVFEAVDDLVGVVTNSNNASTAKIKAMGKKREEAEGTCRWRLVHRGKSIPEKKMHRRFWLKKSELDKLNAPRGLCHRHLLRNWLLCQSDEAENDSKEETEGGEKAEGGTGWKPSERKVSEGSMWGLAKKTVLQKNKEAAEDEKKVPEAKRISRADAAASAARLSKPREPKAAVVRPIPASVQNMMVGAPISNIGGADPMGGLSGGGFGGFGMGVAGGPMGHQNNVTLRGMAGGAMARAAQASQRVEVPVSTMTLGALNNFVEIGGGLGIGMGADPLTGAGRKSSGRQSNRRGSGTGPGKGSHSGPASLGVMGQSKQRGFASLNVGGYGL